MHNLKHFTADWHGFLHTSDITVSHTVRFLHQHDVITWRSAFSCQFIISFCLYLFAYFSVSGKMSLNLRTVVVWLFSLSDFSGIFWLSISNSFGQNVTETASSGNTGRGGLPSESTSQRTTRETDPTPVATRSSEASRVEPTASIWSLGHVHGWNKGHGREGECPSRFRFKRAGIGLCPLTFQWLHSLWSDWNSVKLSNLSAG